MKQELTIEGKKQNSKTAKRPQPVHRMSIMAAISVVLLPFGEITFNIV